MSAPRKTSDPYRSAAALWGALARRYRDTLGERRALPVSVDELAAQVGYGRQTIYAIENGEHLPGDRQKAARWDELVGADGVLLMLWPLASQLGTTPLRDYLGHRDAAYAEARRRSPSPQEDDRVERRRLLRLALVAAGAGPCLSAGESVRRLLEYSLGSSGTAEAATVRDLDEWDLICGDHMHAVLTRPPAQVLPDLLVDLLALEHQLDRAGERTTKDLQRFAARLSAVHANALTRLGDHGAALRWWRTARQAADASGDLDLSLWVRATEAIFGLYGQRSPSAVLRLTDQAIAMTRPETAASPGLAKTLVARSQALALVGRHEEAVEGLQRTADLAVRLPDGSHGAFAWVPDGLPFAESWVYSLQGDEPKADTARERVIERAPVRNCYQNVPNVRLHEALAMVAAGGVEQGVRKAAEIIDGVPVPYRSHMIRETGRLVLRGVPVEHERLPALADLRDVLAAPVAPA